MQLTKEVQERLKQAIAIKGYSHYKIAKELNISATTISNYLTGKIRKPDNTKLKAICRLLGINLNWLLTGQDMVGAALDGETDLPEEGDIDYKFEQILLMLQARNDQYLNIHKDLEHIHRYINNLHTEIVTIKEIISKISQN